MFVCQIIIHEPLDRFDWETCLLGFKILSENIDNINIMNMHGGAGDNINIMNMHGAGDNINILNMHGGAGDNINIMNMHGGRW